MPQVPTYGVAQVGQTQAPANFRSGSSINTGAIVGQQLDQAGQALQQVGQLRSQEEINAQALANQVRVDAALNQVRQQQLALTYDPNNGYMAKKGAAALDPDPLGRSLPQAYGEQLDESISAASGALANEAQRRVFQQQVAPIATTFGGQVQGHMLQEFRQYGLETQQGTIKLAADSAKLNWQNPDLIGPQIKSAQAAVYMTGQINGEPASLTTAKMKETTSAIHVGVIDAALQNGNPDYALGYLNSKKDEMSANDILKVRGEVNKDMYARTADTVASDVMAKYRVQANPSDASRVRAITMNTESGGDEGAIGPNIPGQGTAKGSMQVMDKTNMKPGYGITPAKDDSPEERKRVGGEYIDAMVKEYNGDMAQAWAAYNAGPGTVDKAIAYAEKKGGTWLEAMSQYQSPANHKQTVAYVSKNMLALEQGGGTPPKPNLQQVHDDVRAELDIRFNGVIPPAVLKLAIATSTQQFEDNAKAIKSREEEATVNAMKALEQNGGRVSQLPYAVRSQIPPGKLDDLLSYGAKINRGDDITNNAVYQRLSTPGVLKGLSDNEFFQTRSELSQADFQHFATQRAAALGKGVDKMEELNSSAIDRTMKQYFMTLGIDGTPKDNTPEAQRVGAVRRYVDNELIRLQKTTGKQLTDAEVEKQIGSLFSKSTEFRSSFLGISTGSTSGPMLTMQPNNIPSDVSDRLKADFKAAGIASPTDAQLLGAYWALQAIPKKQPAGQTASGKIKPLAKP